MVEGFCCPGQRPLHQLRWSPSPRNRGEETHALRTLRRPSARWWLDRLPAGTSRHGQTAALGPGADGDRRIGSHPPAGIVLAKPHPCRRARRQGRAVGDGGGRKMRRAFGRDRRIVGRPARARFYRDAATRDRLRAIRRTLLAGAARWHGQFERRPDALADCERIVAAQSARSASARASGVGCRIVPRPWIPARAMDPRA